MGELTSSASITDNLRPLISSGGTMLVQQFVNSRMINPSLRSVSFVIEEAGCNIVVMAVKINRLLEN